MHKSQFSTRQKAFLSFFSSQQSLYTQFYFSGGTCLIEYYLHHRYSEDLDFFSEKEFSPEDITTLLLQSKKLLGNPKIEYQQSFNRNIYQLIYGKNDVLKVEFTYYPFQRIEKTKKEKFYIDSLIDIAVNKLFTIYQNPRGRDYFDLYFILQKEKKLTMKKVLALARIKFDFPIDLIQLGSQLMKVQSLLDDPILVKQIDRQKIEEFFLHEAKLFGKDIISS
jgi:predicted nucleotidyltransferase component of viral defense system